jgi:hypothetical protein
MKRSISDNMDKESKKIKHENSSLVSTIKEEYLKNNIANNCSVGNHGGFAAMIPGLRSDYQKFIIEINEDNDLDDELELLYSYFPTNIFEIYTEKTIKQEENTKTLSSTADDERPKTYKVIINMRDANQQKKFRLTLLDHYKTCIITGSSCPKLLHASHIMPFKQVGSSLETGILLKKELNGLWDTHDISIDPTTWTVHLSEELSKYDDYLKYNNFELPSENIKLLKAARIDLLRQHHDDFKEFEKKRNDKNPINIFYKTLLNKNPLKNKINFSTDEGINLLYETNDISENENNIIINKKNNSIALDSDEELKLVRFELRKKYNISQIEMPILTKKWIYQFIDQNYYLYGQYKRIYEMTNKIFKIFHGSYNIPNSTDSLLGDKNYILFLILKREENTKRDQFFLNIIDSKEKYENLIMHEICHSFLYACGILHIGDIRKEFINIELNYNNYITSDQSVSFKLFLDNFIPSVKEFQNLNYKECFTGFSLQIINAFLIRTYGVFLKRKNNESNIFTICWPSWINDNLKPIEDDSILNKNIPKKSKGREIPTNFFTKKE